jgi:hypothetical protein
MAHRTYQKGECVQSAVINLDNNDAPIDATSVVITITDPAGTVVVNSAGMTKIATGEYVHNYDIPVGGVVGKYEGHAVITTSGHVNHEYSSFKVR